MRPLTELCLHELIAAQAARTPDRVAVVFERERLTYRELDRRADLLAQHLRGLDVGPDTLVGLLVERSLEMVVGILGILKAGAAYVPIDTTYPADRIAYMMDDAKLGCVLTQESLVLRLPGNAPETVFLDTLDWNAAGNPAPPDMHVRPDSLAYVIYTSGSTGRPKGVCIEHRNIVGYVLAISERMRFEPGMNHATVTTIAADLGNTVIFPALVTGGCLHVVSQQRAESQPLLSEYFVREQIDVLKIGPAHLAALQTGQNPQLVMPKSRLILGGEASRIDWIERIRVLAPACEIHNHYGPTETTVGVMTYEVGADLPITRTGTLPMGKPLPHVRVYVLDATGAPVPLGAQGELCIGGFGVGRGYLNRPELTAEKFVPDSFADGPACMYRTGDIARVLADGNIEYCGRIDDQVKVHGYRIELGEIEGMLREHPGIRDAVVRLREDEAGDKRLVGYVVPKRASQALWDWKSLRVLPDGSAVAHLNKNETDYIYNEIFTLQAYLRHGITIRDGDCIVDAGANIGMFTVFVSRLARDLQLFSFEPNPAAFACLKANADAWGGEGGGAVRCFPLGLSNENGSADLTFFEGLSLLSGFHADAATEREVVKQYVFNQAPDARPDEEFVAEVDDLIDSRLRSRTVTAQLRTISSVIEELGLERIDLLKVNVEKSELNVLRGLGPGDWPKIRQLVIEVDLQENLEPITSLLESHGFAVLVEQDPLLRKTELCYVYAIRSSADSAGGLVRHDSSTPYVPVNLPPDGVVLAPATLRAHLTSRLPRYMVPAAFVLMDEFPLTANGKIDRHALPAASFERTPSARRSTPDAATQPASARTFTETESQLARIWAELLKVKQVGLDDDFFDLGGQSLVAIKAVSRIRDVFGVDLPLRNLFEHPTVAGLAAVVDAMSWVAKEQSPKHEGSEREEIVRSVDALARQERAIVPLQPHGQRVPIFAVPGHNGNVFSFRFLAQELGEDQPFFGLQPPGVDGECEPLERVEEMAAYFAERIMAFGSGPYVIAGHCSGGTIAFELARQLVRRGAKVDLLAMFGCPYPSWFRNVPQLLERLALQKRWLSEHVRMLASLSNRQRRIYISERMAERRRQRRAAQEAPKEVAPDEMMIRRAKVAGATLTAVRRYVPLHFSGRVALFYPNNAWVHGGKLMPRWRRVAGNREEHCGPDTSEFDVMLHAPNVRRTAEQFQSCSRRIEETGSRE